MLDDLVFPCDGVVVDLHRDSFAIVTDEVDNPVAGAFLHYACVYKVHLILLSEHATPTQPFLFLAEEGTDHRSQMFPRYRKKEREMSDISTQTITAAFATREAADLAVEHLVQKLGVERTDIFVQSAGSDNASGVKPSGGDAPTSNDVERTDAQLASEIEVSVDIDAGLADSVRAELAALNATDVVTS